MSNKLIGNLSKAVYSLGIVPRKVQYILVDPRTPSWRNRATDAKLISKYLCQAGGFDPAAADPPQYARLPDGRMFRYDRDHTCHMWIAIHGGPEAEYIPPLLSKVVDVDNMKQISELFVLTNYTGRKNLSQEELAIHGLENEVVDQLTEVGVRIDIGTGEEGTVLGDPRGPKTKIKNFQKAITQFGMPAVKEANDFIVSSSTKHLDEYPAELLSGFSFVFKHVNFTEKEKESFRAFFNRLLMYKQHNYSGIHQSLKQRGGSVNAKGPFSVAKGLLEEFLDTIPTSKSKTLKGKLNAALGAVNKELGFRE